MSNRLARLQFIQDHPALAHDPKALARAMRGAGLYAPCTMIGDIAQGIPGLLRSANHAKVAKEKPPAPRLAQRVKRLEEELAELRCSLEALSRPGHPGAPDPGSASETASRDGLPCRQ